jgi:hypothetical protein
MPEELQSRPADHEIEVSLIGPGFGESVVIHLGGGRWAVVDSCLDKESKRAAALTYLERIGVDPAAGVDLVVCTHWHDDHIRGIASVLAECPNARFVCSAALKETAFLEMVALGEEVRGPHGSGLREIEKILKQIQQRRLRHEPAALTPGKAGLILFETIIGGIPVKISSLSPATADHQRMALVFQEQRDLLLSGDYRRAVPSIHPNLASVVIHLEIGTDRILLGADMEYRNTPASGWNAILANPVPEPPATLYKVAHHGSATGDTPEIWSRLLVPDCLAMLAPNQRLANPIPKPADVARILSHTNHAFATAPSLMPRKRLEQPAERLFRRKGIAVCETPASQGHLRSRKTLGEAATWDVVMFGRAFRLSR